MGFCVLSKFTILAAPGLGSLCAVGGSREAAIVVLSLLLCPSSLVSLFGVGPLSEYFCAGSPMCCRVSTLLSLPLSVVRLVFVGELERPCRVISLFV